MDSITTVVCCEVYMKLLLIVMAIGLTGSSFGYAAEEGPGALESTCEARSGTVMADGHAARKPDEREPAAVRASESVDAQSASR